MTDYSELVKALRIRSGNLCPGDICDRCEAIHFLCSDKVMHDAAAAIEELQAEVEKPITLEQAIDRLNELGWLQEHDRILSQPHWVSVEDRLPNVDEKVLVFAVGKLDGFIGETVIALTSMSDTNWLNHHEKVDKPYWLDPWQYFLTDYRITHWMPIEPPKEE